MVLRPDEAIRHLAADLEKVSNVVVQTEALGWKMVELSQSLAHVEPAIAEATSHLAASNNKLEETAHRVLAAQSGMTWREQRLAMWLPIAASAQQHPYGDWYIPWPDRV